MKSNPFKIHEGAVSDRALPGYRHRSTGGDNMLFLPSFAGWLGRTLTVQSVNVLYVFFIVLFVSLIARVTYIQVVRGSEYYRIADQNRVKSVESKAARGDITDRHGSPLVSNIPRFTLLINKGLIQTTTNREELKNLLVRYFPEDSSKFEIFDEQDSDEAANVILEENIPYDKAVLLYAEVAEHPALSIVYEPTRLYSRTIGLAHIIGYTSRLSPSDAEAHPLLSLTDYIGREGVERSYDSVLRGVNGRRDIEVDVFGREKKDILERSPEKGAPLVTTLDADAQEKLYKIMREAVESNGKSAGAAVVMDPFSGDILAMVSYPDYDPNIFSHPLSQEEYTSIIASDKKPLFNRALAGEYPAGSIFKMVVAAAALEKGFITPSFTVHSSGGLYLGDTFFPDWRAGGHGVTNLYSAIANSVNTYFYTVGGGHGSHPGVGAALIGTYARHLGFGNITGIDLDGEQPGRIPDPMQPNLDGRRWFQGDTYNLSIGQGSLLVTPIQVARYMAIFANSGTVVTPRVVSTATSTPTSAPISSETISAIRTALRQTITSGTATSLQSVRVPVAGKTGTAQFSRVKEPHSWFAGFAPFETPRIVIAVIIEEGGDRGLAVTVARQFMEWYFNEYQLDAQ